MLNQYKRPYDHNFVPRAFAAPFWVYTSPIFLDGEVCLLRLCDYNAVAPKLNRILGEFICYGHVNKTNMYLNLCEYLRITHFTAICPTLGGFILLFGCQF